MIGSALWRGSDRTFAATTASILRIPLDIDMSTITIAALNERVIAYRDEQLFSEIAS